MAYLIRSIFFLLFLMGFSSLSSSQSDSCSSNLSVSNLIPFSTTGTNFTCLNAWSSQGFILRYAQSGTNLWSFVLSAPDSGAYIAIGFSSDGGMVGSSAVAGWTTGGPGVVKQYYLGGTRSSACPPDQGNLQLLQGQSLIISQSSRLYLAFQLNISRPPPYLIYAVGPRNNLPSSDNHLPEHQTEASAPVNYLTGVAPDATGGGGGSGLNSAQTHGLLAMLGWGVLMPIGVMMARYFKSWDPQWFYSHTSIQGIGFILGVAGVIMGFRLDGEDDSDVSTHRILGICILVLGCLQAGAFLARPGKAAKVRRYWNWYHWYVGRVALALAIGNVFLGISLANESSSWSIGYGVFLGVWLLVSIVLEVRMWMTSVESK